MEISIEEIQLLARRSRLALTEAEQKKYAADLAALEQLSVALLPYSKAHENDDAPVEPPVLREDRVERSLSPADVLSNAACRTGDCFTVPRVIEEVQA